MLDPIGVPDQMLQENNIGHVWGYGNQIAIYPAKHPTTNSGLAKGKLASKIYGITWETTLYNPQVRKLVNESCGTFTALQNTSCVDNPSKQSELISLSHQYRCIMNACIDDLNHEADLANGESSQDFQHTSEIFYKAELIWNACEIVYLTKPVGILPHLLEWIKTHFPAAVEMSDIVLESPNPSFHESYWKAIYGLIFQLRLDTAIQLLRLHPNFQSDEFQSASELLRKMPIYGTSTSSSTPEFIFRWNHWKDECDARIQAGDFFSVPELELAVKVLSGAEEVFDELEFLFETWYQRMITQLTFVQPTINTTALADEAESFMTAFQGDEGPTSLDCVLMAILRKDTRKMISEMQSVLDNSWFSAHLADLLFHAGVLQSFEDINCLQLRETLLRDYALCLFSHPSLWSIGVLYLDHCPTIGSATLQHLLTNLHCESEFKANKLLALAERRKLTSVSSSICRVAGHRALANGRLGAAIAWAVRAQDSTLATRAADSLLKNYVQNSDFVSTDLLDSLGAGLMASDRLAFLGKYREFHRLYNKNDFHSAAALLISLISSRIAPKNFWTVLLMDALPLLETNPPVFTTDQTYELMQSLQELTSSFQDVEPNCSSNCDLNPDKIMLITLALSRNLAKCYVQQSLCD